MTTQNSSLASYGSTKNTYKVVFNIFDVATKEKIEDFRVKVHATSRSRALLLAVPRCSHYVAKLARRAARKQFGATASQLRRAEKAMLFEFGLVLSNNYFVVDVASARPIPRRRDTGYFHPYVQEVLADCLY